MVSGADVKWLFCSWEGIAKLKTDWKMEKADLCKFMSDSVAAAIGGEEAKATAFWQGIAKLKTDWKMEKADLCKFMSNSVAAAICGEEAKDSLVRHADCRGVLLVSRDLEAVVDDDCDRAAVLGLLAAVCVVQCRSVDACRCDLGECDCLCR